MSSYRATAGLEAAPEWLDVGAALSPFAPDVELAQAYYGEFVAQKIDSKRAALGPGNQRNLSRQPFLGQVDPQVDRVEAALDGSSEKAAGDRTPEDACRHVGSGEGRR